MSEKEVKSIVDILFQQKLKNEEKLLDFVKRKIWDKEVFSLLEKQKLITDNLINEAQVQDIVNNAIRIEEQKKAAEKKKSTLIGLEKPIIKI